MKYVVVFDTVQLMFGKWKTNLASMHALKWTFHSCCDNNKKENFDLKD